MLYQMLYRSICERSLANNVRPQAAFGGRREFVSADLIAAVTGILVVAGVRISLGRRLPRYSAVTIAK